MRHGDLAANGRNIDDMSSTPRPHFRNDLRNQFVRRPEMKLHGAFKILARHVLKRTHFDNTGVIDQNVDLPKAIDNLTNGSFNLCGIEQIALNPESIRGAATSIEIGFCARQLFPVPGDESNAPALCANMSGKHEPKSARTACDNGHFVAQCVTRSANDAYSYPRSE